MPDFDLVLHWNNGKNSDEKRKKTLHRAPDRSVLSRGCNLLCLRGFMTAFVDVNHDGRLDILNGHAGLKSLSSAR